MHEAAAALDGENPPKLLDVRAPEEFDLAHIENARMFTQELNMEMSGWPRDTPILFTCHEGRRSMDAASFFLGHGFTNVRYMEGGIDAWCARSTARFRVMRSSGTPGRSRASSDR